MCLVLYSQQMQVVGMKYYCSIQPFVHLSSISASSWSGSEWSWKLSREQGGNIPWISLLHALCTNLGYFSIASPLTGMFVRGGKILKNHEEPTHTAVPLRQFEGWFKAGDFEPDLHVLTVKDLALGHGNWWHQHSGDLEPRNSYVRDLG